MYRIGLEELLEIGIALSKEHDRSSLLDTILLQAMHVANCDGGTLYIKDNRTLRFEVMVTNSLGVHKGGVHEPIDLPPVPFSEDNVCAYAAMHGKLLNIPDVRESSLFNFSGPRTYDQMTGYRTQSMLVVPMENDQDEVIGVLQLINALGADGSVTRFDASCEQIVFSLACQTAICLTNMLYASEIQEMLDSFVRALATAVDARSPYNANHTRNMVVYATRVLDYLEETGDPRAFPPEKRREFLMSVWLHDIGKLVIPLEVMDKSDRLGARLDTVRHRMEIIGLLDELALARGQISEAEAQARADERARAQALVEEVNRAGFLSDAKLRQVQELSRKTWVDASGQAQPWLTPEELTCLSIRKGTLTGEEREIMRSHVVMTEKVLCEMHFPERYAHVPLWASGHHEMLNGSGYPRALTDGSIPMETRLLTILDIFEALTAQDRPYRPAMPLEKALAVLRGMTLTGELDPALVEMFCQARPWEAEL